jgi:hypothetical protein
LRIALDGRWALSSATSVLASQSVTNYLLGDKVLGPTGSFFQVSFLDWPGRREVRSGANVLKLAYLASEYFRIDGCITL